MQETDRILNRSFIVEWYIRLPYAFLAGTKSSEVLHRQRVRVGEVFYHDLTNRYRANGNIEENSWVIRHRRLITGLGFCYDTTRGVWNHIFFIFHSSVFIVNGLMLRNLGLFGPTKIVKNKLVP